MSAHKWLTIAKSTYYTSTGDFRKIRPFFPFLVIVLLVVFVFYLAPKIVAGLLDVVVAFFLSQIAVVMVQAVLFMIFFMFISMPIVTMLKDINIGQQWILLKAPVKPSDILLGEFLGELPSYTILITLVAGFFTTLLDPLQINAAQKALIVLVFVIILSSALWIGTVIQALLRTKLGRSSHGRDMGKALSILIVVPFVAFMYAFMAGGIHSALSNPGTGGIFRTILTVFPSTWGAEVISSVVLNPGNIAASGVELVTYFGGLITFFAAILWIGIKLADRAYSLEAVTFTTAKVSPDGVFYKTMNNLGGGQSFGTLLVSIFKVYTRRLHNLSWLAYAAIYAGLMNFFAPPSIRPDRYMGVIVMGSLVFSILAVAVASDVTIRGKENLLLFKKVPSGVATLIRVRLIQSWLIVIPLGLVIVVLTILRIPEMAGTLIALYMGLTMLMTAAYVVFALGLFLLNPVYSEKGGTFFLNFMIIGVGSLFLCIGLLNTFGEVRGTLVFVLLMWILGIVLLLLGKRHLVTME